MPANTMGHTQFSISDEVRTTYSKYHGGVDWSRLAYQVQNGSAVQPATLKLYCSLDGSLTASQLDQQATLFETLTIPPSATQTVTSRRRPRMSRCARSWPAPSPSTM